MYYIVRVSMNVGSSIIESRIGEDTARCNFRDSLGDQRVGRNVNSGEYTSRFSRAFLLIYISLLSSLLKRRIYRVVPPSIAAVVDLRDTTRSYKKSRLTRLIRSPQSARKTKGTKREEI